MLDVHAPHAGIQGWKDFFIHIATITIGLLIAIGLEQTVEHFHHLNQLQTARRELAVELEEDREIFSFNRVQLTAQKAELTRDMAILIASRDTHTPLRGHSITSGPSGVQLRWLGRSPARTARWN